MGPSKRWKSDWCIARQPRDTIEVGIITGEVGQTMGLHDRDDQGVTHEQFVLLADQSRGFDKKWSDRGDLDSQERDARDGLDMHGSNRYRPRPQIRPQQRLEQLPMIRHPEVQ